MGAQIINLADRRPLPPPLPPPKAQEGDGGPPMQVTINFVFESRDPPEPEPPKRSGLGAFLWGAFFGWWLGS